MRHYHVVIQGYRSEKDNGDLTDVTVVDVIVEPTAEEDRDEEHAVLVAMQRAKRVVTKQSYRLMTFIEHNDYGACSRVR